MKVYIGPYPNDRLNIYRILDKYQRKGYLSEETCDKWTERLQPYTDPVAKVLNRNNKRKIDVTIDPYDVWSMDTTLSLIIAPMLRMLKQRKQGSPYIDDEDVPEHLRSYNAPPKENTWDTDDNHHLRWEWVLDEMIFAFEQHENSALDKGEWEDQFYSGEQKWIEIPVEGSDLLVEIAQCPKSTFKIDHDGMTAWGDRMQNGFRLFGKYYSGLWD